LEIVLAAVAVVDLGWVAFDLSYVSWRDLYHRYLPALTERYDPIKGIEPHRVTTAYLKTVDELEAQLRSVPGNDSEGGANGLASPAVQELLTRLRQQSTDSIQDNPFQISNRLGNFEKAKNRLRDRMGLESATASFQQFWSVEHLQKAGWKKELAFFDSQIRPLFAANFYRNIDESGQPVDRSWLIDSGFIAFFGLEFLARTFIISRRHRSLSWPEAMLWRWFDLPLLLPFWRWLRVVPVAIRLGEAQLIDLNPVRLQVVRGVTVYLAEEMTELVIVRAIGQTQAAIRDGHISRRLLASAAGNRDFIDVDGVDTVSTLLGHLVEVVVYRVLPRIQPEMEALLAYGIDSTYARTTVYRNLQAIPGVGQLPHQLTQQLATRLSQSLYGTLIAALENPKGQCLYDDLVQTVGRSLQEELLRESTLQELQSRFSNLLEEIKLNYVQQLEQEDAEQILQEVERLREQRR
jgi:hypothetical protein